jgi:hypothetical protein
VTCVLLTKLVTSTDPPTWIAVVLVKPVPVTVSVVAPEPALTLVGEIDDTVGAAAGGGVVVVPLLDEEEQPAKNGTKRPRKEARNKLWIRMTDCESLAATL